MKFVSIRQKLITRGSLIFVLSFASVLTIVAFLYANSAQKHQRSSEANIRSALIAKGRTLVNNNSQALRGLVADNAFTAVKELVATTVRDDDDIVYGIFVDAEQVVWVHASTDNPEGDVGANEKLDDEISQWAAAVTEFSYTTTKIPGAEVYEFAAPVRIGKETLGVIRYGFTTEPMKNSLKQAEAVAYQALVRIMLILIGVGGAAVAVGIISTRRIAGTITEPLQRLAQSAETIAAGDYLAEVKVRTDDEIGTLSKNFDSMRITIKKKMADLAKLNQTGELLAASPEQEQALLAVLKAMCEQTGLSKGAAYLLNAAAEGAPASAELKARYPEHGASVANAAPGLDARLLLQCELAKKIIFAESFDHDAAATSADYDQHAVAITASIWLPLLDEDHLIGVLHIFDAGEKIRFEESDHEFASSVARLLVTTLKNIRMREVIEEQNRTLEQKVERRTQELKVTMQALAAEKESTEVAYRSLDKANKQVLESIDYARRIQYAMLPDKHALDNAVKDIAVWWQPLHVVGGDYFWLQQSGHLSVILIADCTGHGVPGAFITLVLASALDRVLNDQGLRSPAAILKAIDEIVRVRLRQDRPDAESDDGMDAAICVWNSHTRQLCFAGAHLPLLIWRMGLISELKGDRNNLAYCTRRGELTFTEHIVDVLPNDIFYLCTDGVVDQMGGAPRKLLGRRRLAEILSSSALHPLSRQLELLQTQLTEYRGTEHVRDDATLIIFQPL